MCDIQIINDRGSKWVPYLLLEFVLDFIRFRAACFNKNLTKRMAPSGLRSSPASTSRAFIKVNDQGGKWIACSNSFVRCFPARTAINGDQLLR